MKDTDGQLSFEELRRSDFPRLRGWLIEPLVKRWWNQDSTPEAIESHFGPAVDGSEPTDAFVVGLGGRPVGLIQRYRIDAYAEYLAEIAPICHVSPGALSIDYLFGEPDVRGRGLAAAMVDLFVEMSWKAYPDSNVVMVPVSIHNRASWRTLERAGFERIARGDLKPDDPRDSPDHFIYVRQRAGTRSTS